MSTVVETGRRIKVITPVFRTSFPYVFTPAPPMRGTTPQPGAPTKYSVVAVWDPSTFDEEEKRRWSLLQKVANEICLEKFKKSYRDLPPHFKKPFRDGAEKAHMAGFGPGKIFATISSHMRPGIVDADNITPITDPNDFYPGVFARASVTFYTYQNVSTGLAMGLSNLKKVRDGERLDSRTSADEDFADLGEADMDPGMFAAGTNGEDFL